MASGQVSGTNRQVQLPNTYRANLAQLPRRLLRQSIPHLRPSDFNNLSYTGCVLQSSGHTYLDLNITVTDRLNATVNYLNAFIIVQTSQISNGFHSSSNYTEQVSGPTNTYALELSSSIPIDNVVSGSVTVEVIVEGASNQVVPIILHPSIPLSPSDYQQCTGCANILSLTILAWLPGSRSVRL